jgi:peptide/nickel transport system ATP-binding protein
MRLLGDSGKVIDGRILFEGRNLLELSDKEYVDIRGHQISMIFQEPISSLDPSFTIGDQIAEVFQVHQGINKREAWDNAINMLALVGIPDPRKPMFIHRFRWSGTASDDCSV